MPTNCTVTTEIKVSIYLATQLEQGFELTKASIPCQVNHKKAHKNIFMEN